MQTVPSGLRPLGLREALSVPERRIDFVPLFDVLLLGFMFLMLGSRFVFAPGISIELPQSSHQALGGIPTLDVLTAKNDNFLIFQGTKYSLDGLERFLVSDLWEQPPEESYLLLKADQSVDLQTFVTISQMAKTAGYAGVQLAVKDPGEESRSGLDEESKQPTFSMTEVAAKASPLFSLGNAAGGLIVLGVGIHLAGFLIFRVVAEPTHEPLLQEPFVKLLPETIESSGALNESALLSDSEPLFLPTKWNASAIPVQTSTTANQASPFDAFAAEIQMGTDESGTMFDTRVLIPENPLEGLELNPGSVFSSFGQDVPLDVGRRVPGIKVDVHDYTTGETRLSETLDSNGLTIELPQEWRFVEFRVAVDPLGHVGRPVLVDGTGDESVDRALSDYLHSANAVSKLPPGYYRIVLGP